MSVPLNMNFRANPVFQFHLDWWVRETSQNNQDDSKLLTCLPNANLVCRNRWQSFTGTVRGGLLVPLTAESSRVNDRFYLGGPLSVRGFKNGGLGPRCGSKSRLFRFRTRRKNIFVIFFFKGPKKIFFICSWFPIDDALGGDVYWGAGASLMTPLSNQPQRLPVYGHAWVNAGSLLSLNKSKRLFFFALFSTVSYVIDSFPLHSSRSVSSRQGFFKYRSRGFPRTERCCGNWPCLQTQQY